VPEEPLDRIARLRKDIARIDQQIVSLIAWRLQVADEIGNQKRLAGLPVRNFRAEVDVLERSRAACSGFGIDPEIGQAVFQVLIEAAVGLQHQHGERSHQSARRSVLVVGGCGRMGTWLCNFFAAGGHEVKIYDRPGLCLPGFEAAESLAEAARAADVVVLSTPIGETRGILESILEAGPKGLVFDICSLKSPIVDTLRDGAKRGLRVASLHPLFAPDTVLLTGRILMVCDCGDPAAAAEARQLFDDTALRMIELPIERHDAYMAYVLGLSHAVNIAFARTLARSGMTATELESVASTTFAKQSRTTREVAFENPQLYYEIQHFNANTAEVLDALRGAVDDLKAAALEGRSDAFVSLMAENRVYFEGR
jgi:chorismate mutase/prephenate dehydrogenase